MDRTAIFPDWARLGESKVGETWDGSDGRLGSGQTRQGGVTDGAHLKSPRGRPLEEEVTFFWLSSFNARTYFMEPVLPK